MMTPDRVATLPESANTGGVLATPEKASDSGAPQLAFARKFCAVMLAAVMFVCAQDEAHAAITAAQVTQAAVTTAATTQTTAAFTPVANTLYLMWTIQTIGTGPPSTPTAACANGLAMVQVNTVTFATTTTQLKRLTLFRAMKPSGLVNGTCTITWGQTTTGHGHVILSFAGADASGADGFGAVVQSVTGRTNSATAAAGLSITLAALQAGSATAGGFSNEVNNANSLTAGAGYTSGTGAAFNNPATGIRAERNVTGSTTVNMTQSATSNIGGIAVEIRNLPTTTLATGTDPLATTIAPGVGATDVDLFTLQTSSGTEAVTSVTVNLSTNIGISRLAVTDSAGTELGATTTPAAGVNVIPVTGMTATTTSSLTPFKVRITPLSHALMPAPPGAAYSITALVTAWAGLNNHAGSDTNPNTLTIDNLSPVGATTTTGTAGSANVTLGWTTSSSADFNTTNGSVLYRWTTATGAEVPAEGSTPTVNSTSGTATVACVLSSPASTALSGIIDGTGGSAGCNTTALASSTAYAYKIFQKDSNGNYDTGVTIGTFTIGPTATTNAASGITNAVATLNGTVSSNGASTTVTFEYGLSNAYGESVPATQSPLVANAVNTPVSAQVIGLNCNTLFHYRVVATNSSGTANGLDGTFTTGLCTSPYPATACAATRFNGDLNCTANDVSLTNIALAPSSISACVSGTPVSLDLDLTVNFASPNRYDAGIFIANDGKLPTLLPANGGASSCAVDILPITPPASGYTFPDLDGVPQGTLDTCGDGNTTINGGTGSGVKRMYGVTLPCYASPASGGKLFVPFAVSWDNQRSPVGNLCTSNQHPVPNTSSKCNAPLSSVSINVVVLPVLTKTNGGSTLSPGANTTYTAVIFNNSGGTLLDMVFTDPAVTNLAVNSVSCAAAGGALCPTTNVAAMQGAGISVPSASLPNNGSLTFTISATVSASAPVNSHIINTATVTLVGGSSTAAVDDDTIVLSPTAAKSFAPSTITEGAVSVLTVTLTNPTVAAVTGVAFTDTYPSGLVNTATANGATSCGGTVTAANGGSVLTVSGATIPASSSCTVTVNVTSLTAGGYTNSTGAISSGSGAIPAASATLTVNVAVFGAFNACDVAAAPNANCTNTTTSTDSRLSTRLAGTAFSLDLVALRTNGTRNTSYNNAVVVQLLDASDNSGALDIYNCRSTWTTAIATLSPNPAFSGADNGLLTVGTFSVPNAYRDVRVRVSNSGGATRIGCSTDNFAIRPSAATLVTTANATASPPSALNTPTIAAGASFTLYATTATGINYTGTLALDNSKLTAQITSQDTSQQGGGTVGTLLPATLAGNPTPPSNNAAYSEVGYLYLGAGAYRDDSYTSVDAGGDCTSSTGQTNPPVPDYLSDVLVNGKYGCSVGNKAAVSLGRFIPHHFTTALTRGCVAGSFTYSGQPFDAVVSAVNSASAVTQNYAGSYAKIVTLSDGGTSNVPCSIANCSVASNRFSAGVATLDAASTWQPALTFATATSGPANPAILRAISTEVVTPVVTVTSLGFAEGSTVLRSGMLKLANAYGSELLDLRVPATAVYWNGTNWATNTLDSCTSIAKTAVALGNYKGTLSVGNTGTSHLPAAGITLNGGLATLVVTKPSPTAVGSVDLAMNLGATSGDANCIGGGFPAATAGANLSWLRGNWCGGSYNKDPNARLTFGSAKAPFIYIREKY